MHDAPLPEVYEDFLLLKTARILKQCEKFFENVLKCHHTEHSLLFIVVLVSAGTEPCRMRPRYVCLYVSVFFSFTEV